MPAPGREGLPSGEVKIPELFGPASAVPVRETASASTMSSAVNFGSLFSRGGNLRRAGVVMELFLIHIIFLLRKNMVWQIPTLSLDIVQKVHYFDLTFIINHPAARYNTNLALIP